MRLRETKKSMINDIMELINWCENNNKKEECYDILHNFKQNRYMADTLLERTLGYKTKWVLDELRERLLLDVVNA